MQRMSRAQRIIVMYLLMKSQEPRLIQRFTRRYVGGGGVSDHSKLTGVTASQHHTKYTDAEAVTAVEVASLTLQNDLDLATNTIDVNYATLSGPTWADVDVGLTGGVANELRVTNAAHQQGVLKNLRVNNLVLHGSIGLLDAENLHGQGDYATSYDLYAGTSGVSGGVVATVHARSAEGINDYRIDLLKVVMSNLPVADPADGLSRVWVSVGGGPAGEDMLCRGT